MAIVIIIIKALIINSRALRILDFIKRALLDDATIAKFQTELSAMGYKFQFHHAGRISRTQLRDVRSGAGLRRAADVGLCRVAGGRIRRRKSTATAATKHQREVGTGYFDEVTQVIMGSTLSRSRRWPDRPRRSSWKDGHH